VATQVDYAQSNAAFFDCVENGREKQAADSLNDFTRLKVRELSFMDNIIAPFKVDDTELDMQYDTDKPCKVFEREPDSPAAVSVPLGTTPTMFYVRGPRYRVMMARILTPRMTKDIAELRTYRMDIRQIVADNMIKDLLAEKDTKYLAAVTTALVGQDQTVPLTGAVQWKSYAGGMTRTNYIESTKIMPSTSAHLESAVELWNNLTIKEWQKFGRDEMGGDLSQQLLKDGYAQSEWNNKRRVITIKRGLVPDGTYYQFAGPEYIGKSLYLVDTTVYVKHEGYFIDSFAYWYGGASIANVAGLARTDFV
jgi:hypothetical protein